MASKNTIYLPYRQTFALPESLISYFIKSGTPKASEKLLQSCQYFFLQKPVYPVQCVLFDSHRTEGHVACYDQEHYNEWLSGRRFLNLPIKLWLHHTFHVHANGSPSKIAAQILQKVYQCNLKVLRLFRQRINHRDYLFLTESKTIESLVFNYNTVTYDNGDIVAFEDILKALPNIFWLDFSFFLDLAKTGVTGNTMANLLKLPPFKNLRQIVFLNMPVLINAPSFATFISKQEQLRLCKLWYARNQNDATIEDFNATFNTVIKEWKSKEFKPELSIKKY